MNFATPSLLRPLERVMLALAAVTAPLVAQAQQVTDVYSAADSSGTRKIEFEDGTRVYRKMIGTELYIVYPAHATDFNYCSFYAGRTKFRTASSEHDETAGATLSSGEGDDTFRQFATAYDKYLTDPAAEDDQAKAELSNLAENVLQQCASGTPTKTGLVFRTRHSALAPEETAMEAEPNSRSSTYYTGSLVNYPIPGPSIEVAPGILLTPYRYAETPGLRQLVIAASDIVVTYSTAEGGVPERVVAHGIVTDRSCQLEKGSASATLGPNQYITNINQRVISPGLANILRDVPRLTGDPTQPEARRLRSELIAVKTGGCRLAGPRP